MDGEQRGLTGSAVAALTTLRRGQIGAALDRADVGRAPPERDRERRHRDDAEAREEA